jgi:hypothetical protein
LLGDLMRFRSRAFNIFYQSPQSYSRKRQVQMGLP